MDDSIVQFAQILAVPIVIALAYCYMLASLGAFCFPINYAAASLPFWITFAFWLREMNRRQTLGFAHDRLREIPEEQMNKALDEIERLLKKRKPLP